MTKKQVFVSYCWADEEAVRPIVTPLRQHFDVWFDQSDLEPGKPWLEQAEEALRVARCSVVICGNSAGAGQEKELQMAVEGAKKRKPDPFLIPVLLPGVDQVPKVLDIPPGILQVRFKKDVNEETAQTQLVGAVRSILRQSVYGIEVVIPKVAKTCVVTSPRPGSESLVSSVKTVIDDLPKNSSAHFPEKVVELPACGTDENVRSIRETELLIADCRDNGFSPEAGYCLGMADALGKPTVLILQNGTNLPIVSAAGQRMRPKVEIIEYAPAVDLKKELTERLRKICSEVSPPFLVDQGVLGIHAFSLDWEAVRAQIRPQLVYLGKFGLSVLKNGSPILEAAHGLKNLFDEAWQDSEKKSGPDRERAISSYGEPITRRHRDFEARREPWESAFIKQFDLVRKSDGTTAWRQPYVEQAFESIASRLNGPPPECFKSAQEAWKNICQGVPRYTKYLSDFSQYCGNDIASCLTVRGTLWDTEQAIKSLSEWLGTISTQADRMVIQLLTLAFDDITFALEDI